MDITPLSPSLDLDLSPLPAAAPVDTGLDEMELRLAQLAGLVCHSLSCFPLRYLLPSLMIFSFGPFLFTQLRPAQPHRLRTRTSFALCQLTSVLSCPASPRREACAAKGKWVEFDERGRVGRRETDGSQVGGGGDGLNEEGPFRAVRGGKQGLAGRRHERTAGSMRTTRRDTCFDR